MVVKGQDNFRNLLYPEYKLNRHADPTKTNMFVPVLRELAVAEGLAIAAHGREADDYIRIWAREASLAGDPYVICSIDKDLECIPGKHYKIPIKQNLSIDKGEIKEISVLESLHLYYRQLLMGDSTDNIPGIPGVGKVKATKYLKDTKEESEMQEIVVEHYMAFYGDEWFDYLLSNAKMIHLQRTTDDYFSAKEWPVLRHLLNL
jgi:DNA polymerase-1